MIPGLDSDRIGMRLGHRCHDVTLAGRPGFLMEPSHPRPGQPWVWKAEFPDTWTEADRALVDAGFHLAHLVVGNTFGSPPALALWDRFYAALVAAGLSSRPVLFAISRGGLYAYRWAADHPQAVAGIVADNPVCDFRSWPGGRDGGPGSPWDWSLLLQCYDFADEAEALAYPGQPIDRLAPLAAARIPLLHRVGDADEIVPVASNTQKLADRYRALGGCIEVLTTPGGLHHPHGLPDPAPIVEFCCRATDSARTTSP